MPPGQNDRSGFFPSAVPCFSETEGKDMYQPPCGSLVANNGEKSKKCMADLWKLYHIAHDLGVSELVFNFVVGWHCTVHNTL
jgi:hypothetical protein